jgi:NDP-sugar pyrophosphorylase family protein
MVAAGLDVRARPVRGLWRDVGRPEDLEAMARLLAGRDRGA